MVGIFQRSAFGTGALDVWDGNPEYDEYEEEVRLRIEEDYSTAAFVFRLRRLFEFPDGVEICPDIVVLLKHDHGEEYVCVVDAKYRKRLEKQHVAKVVEYRERLGAPDARLYVPTTCRIQSGARALAEEKGVRIFDDLESCVS